MRAGIGSTVRILEGDLKKSHDLGSFSVCPPYTSINGEASLMGPACFLCATLLEEETRSTTRYIKVPRTVKDVHNNLFGITERKRRPKEYRILF